jgi:hypothetical protein
MPEPLSRARAHLHVDVVGNERRLSNTAPVAVRRLVYSTYARLWDYPDEGDVVVTRRPYYEITDLPSGASITLEEVDPYEDGSPTFRLEEVTWADGREEEAFGTHALSSLQGLLNTVATKKMDEERLRIKAEAVPVSQHLDAEPAFLRADESRVIRAAE